MAEKEYIEREAARPDAFCEGVSCQECPFCKDHIKGGCRVEDFIKAIPAADVVPVRHGTWIKADEQPYFRKHYHAKVCSECGKRKDGKWLYCPYCGSKNQDGGQDNG